MKKIVFVNAHWNNRGDEAAIRAIIDSVISEFPGIRITIIFKDSKKEICQYPYYGQADYITTKFFPSPTDILKILFRKGAGCQGDMKRTVEAIQDADLIVYAPGGAVISDRFWWKKQMEYLFPVICAQRFKIPVFFAAPSVGPFLKKRIIRNMVLRKVNLICVREEYSKESLQSEGITENVLTTIDSAFLNQIDYKLNGKIYNADKELKTFIEGHKKVIGITITDFAWHVEYHKEEGLKEKIRKAFESFIYRLGEEGTGVLLIPQLFGNQNDKDYLKTYQTHHTFVLSDEEDAYYQQYVISQLYGVIGMRYHSNIFAAKMGVPFCPVVYEEKMKGFVSEANWEEGEIALCDLSPEKLWEKYEWIQDNYEELVQYLKSRHQDWKSKAEETRDNLFKMIKDA